MEPIPLKQLLQGIPHDLVAGTGEERIAAICEDSRRCVPGALFAALPGRSTDGHRFIADAVRNGAVAVLCRDLPDELPPCAVVRVEEPRRVLAQLAQRFYGEPSERLQVIGVTGTNGKTTVTFLLRHLLEASGIPTGLIGTTGAYIGAERLPTAHTTPTAPELARFLHEMWRRGLQAVVMEVSSHALDQYRVDGVRFRAAAFTNLSHEHLDYHGSMEAYARAKQRLFALLSADAVAVIAECPPWDEWMQCAARCRVLRVGQSEQAHVQFAVESLGPYGSGWRMRFPGVDRWVDLQAPLLGAFNVANAAVAAAIAWAMGTPPELLQAALRTAPMPPGRMETLQLPNGATALIDYAHTPDALERLLSEVRRLLPPNGRLVCVFGCGGNRDREKRPRMGAIAVRYADAVVLTNDNPRWEEPQAILQEILHGVPHSERQRVELIPDRAQAIEHALCAAREGDIVVIAGKGHETVQIIGDTVQPFSDRRVVEEWCTAQSAMSHKPAVEP